MTTQPTNLPVPSESPRDLKFNAGKIDEFVTSLVHNYVDRFGNEHYTIAGLSWLAQQAIAQYGWIPVGTFQAGATLTLPNHILKDTTSGEYYRWDGQLPKVVPVGSTPSSTGGTGVNAWLSVGDSTLRSMLASSVGASNVGKAGGGTVQDFISIEDYRRLGDIRGFGVTGIDITPVNAEIIAGTAPGALKIPKGSWTGKLELKNKTSANGESITSTVLTVPKDSIGIKPEGADVRGLVLSNINLQVNGAVAGGAPVGTGVGIDMSYCTKAVNCEFSNLYLDFFDIGYNAGPADFSNVYTNVRCNNNRIGINLTSNGTIIQNVFNGCYVANWTAYGLKLTGVINQIFNCLNMGHNGATNAYFVHIDNNSRGVLFNACNFEMDQPGGKLSAGGQAILIASDSEVTFNSPVFNKLNAAGGNTYLLRVRGTAVVRINDPEVYGDDGTSGHLIISDNAVVYLNDPKNAFKTILVQGNGKLIRVSDKLDNTPDFAKIVSVQSGTIVPIGFYPRHVTGTCNYSASGVVGSEKYVVIFDTYTSTNGTATARVIDTTTGAVASGITRSVFVQAWK
ncbi:hypothetical protein [Enterobacter cancerogenus]|uniref:tail fiber/spike domain-containing protein n=1 Tax=Enterobacter cancerogenus TaxID=69218 RepID=UPI00073427F6|nr:hypothetical protein [Enterobacter cancerogenus]